MDILVTGFNKFGDLEFNPSQILVEELERRKFSYKNFNLYSAVLPTEYKMSGRKIEELIDSVKPRIILLTGVTQNSESMIFERFALNIDDSEYPDNIGYNAQGIKIKDDGNEAYITSFPLKKIINDLNKLGVKIKISNHAGTYVCNHVYYIANYLITTKQLDISCGFLHIPLLSLNKNNTPDSSGLNIVKLVSVIEQMLLLLNNYYK